MNYQPLYKTPPLVSPPSHTERIKRELLTVGMWRFGLNRPETRYLPKVIHLDEYIGGVAYGQQEEGSVLLAATDRRVIFLDKKPFFVNQEEVTYDVVSGVNFYSVGPYTTIRLHTRVRDFVVHTFNKRSAEQFVRYVETRRLVREEGSAAG